MQICLAFTPNHSIRATSITILHNAGFEARHIVTEMKIRLGGTVKLARKPKKKCREN